MEHIYFELSKSLYTHENLTVDEQLFPTKFRCRFTQFMSQNPDKYGIKIWILSEVDNIYLLNEIPYLGKDDGFTSKWLGEQVTLEFTGPIGTKITMWQLMNFFVVFSKKLTARKISFLGTVIKDRRKIPRIPRQSALSTSFYTTTMAHCYTCYQAKKSKMCFLLSTRYEIGVMKSEDPKLIPNTILCYNQTKLAVDTFDRSSSVMNWCATIAFDHVFQCCWLGGHQRIHLFQKVNGRKLSRRRFLKKLVDELVRKSPLELILLETLTSLLLEDSMMSSVS